MLRVDISSDLAYLESEGWLMKTKKGFNRRKHISGSSSRLEMVHAFQLVYNYRVYNMNNPIKYHSVGHLVAPFTINAATWGERFQNGDLSLWNLVVSAPYTADNPRAIFIPASTSFIALFWPKWIQMAMFYDLRRKTGAMRGKKCGTLHDFACHPCAGAMLIFSVSFQF